MFAAGARRCGPSISRIAVVPRRVILKHFRNYCPRVWEIILAITAYKQYVKNISWSLSIHFKASYVRANKTMSTVETYVNTRLG